MSVGSHSDPLPHARPEGLVDLETMVGREHTHRRISWAAILGAVILVVAVQLLLSMLGAGIGLGTVDINAGSTPRAGSLGIGAGLWWMVSSIIALGFGGYVAAWLAGIELRWDGVLHGLITWGIASLLTIYLLSSAIGSVIGGGFSAIGSVSSAAGSGLKEVAQPLAQAAGVSPDMLQQQAQAYLKPPASDDPASMTPEAAQKEVVTNLVTYAKGGPDASGARARVIAIMAAQQHISPEEATKQFDAAQAKVTQAREQAVQTAKNAADESAAAASKAAFGGFAVLLLGALAAAIGGSLAVQRRARIVR